MLISWFILRVEIHVRSNWTSTTTHRSFSHCKPQQVPILATFRWKTSRQVLLTRLMLLQCYPFDRLYINFWPQSFIALGFFFLHCVGFLFFFITALGFFTIYVRTQCRGKKTTKELASGVECAPATNPVPTPPHPTHPGERLQRVRRRRHICPARTWRACRALDNKNMGHYYLRTIFKYKSGVPHVPLFSWSFFFKWRQKALPHHPLIKQERVAH